MPQKMEQFNIQENIKHNLHIKDYSKRFKQDGRVVSLSAGLLISKSCLQTWNKVNMQEGVIHIPHTKDNGEIY